MTWQHWAAAKQLMPQSMAWITTAAQSPTLPLSSFGIDSDDLDSNGSPTLAYDVGVLTGTPGDTTRRTCGTEFFAATTASQAAGVTRLAKGTGFRIAPVGYDRSIGIKITTAAATQATSGLLALALNVKG